MGDVNLIDLVLSDTFRDIKEVCSLIKYDALI